MEFVQGSLFGKTLQGHFRATEGKLLGQYSKKSAVSRTREVQFLVVHGGNGGVHRGRRVFRRLASP